MNIIVNKLTDNKLMIYFIFLVFFLLLLDQETKISLSAGEMRGLGSWLNREGDRKEEQSLTENRK